MKKQTKIRTMSIIFTLLIVLITAHILGYRIYGPPKLVSNQPLQKPQKLIDINSSGEVILKNNMKYSIYGIVIVIPDPFKQLRYFQLQQEHEIQVDKANDEMNVDKARIWYKHRNQYWCGNTWMPSFFPPRLYKYRKMDIAQILIEHGAAIPNVELFSKHRAYAKELMERMRGNVGRMNILQNHDEVVRLGEYLCRSEEEYFNIGAWLLAHSKQYEIAPAIKKHIEKYLDDYDQGVIKKGGFSSNPRYTIASSRKIMDLISALIKLSPEDARKELHTIIDVKREAYLRVRFALKLLAMNDLYGMDKLIEEVRTTKMRKGIRSGLAFELERVLSNSCRGQYFSPDNDEAMCEWYRNNRQRLLWNEEKWQITLSDM
ncbi:MAG: hypothetical protein ACFFDT_29770 [Candidatus Hodarchaeota archaeon]